MANKNKLITFYGASCLFNGKRIKNFKSETFPDLTEAKDYYNKLSQSEFQNIEMSEEQEFIKILIHNGDSQPWHNEVYDTSNIDVPKKLKNPRDINLAEPKEVFAIIDKKTSQLWISNTKKKSCLITLFKKQFDINLSFKELIDEQKFIDSLSSLDGLKFSVYKDDLLNCTNDYREFITSQMDEADIAKIELKYSKKPINKNKMDIVKNFIKERNSFKSMTILGTDKNNREMILNTKLIAYSYQLSLPISETGLFRKKEVFSEIIGAIKK